MASLIAPTDHSINNQDLKNNKIKSTASEMSTPIRLFGVIIGDLVQFDNPFWRLYHLLRDILEYTLAKTLPRNTGQRIKVLIEQYQLLYMESTGDTLKPKDYILQHSADVFNQSGPPAHLSSIRFQAKHLDLTGSASVNMSRVNICHSLAIKHQISLCYKFLANEKITPSLQTGPGDLLECNHHDPYYNLPTDLQSMKQYFVANWIEYQGTIFKPGMALVLDTHSDDFLLVFGKIERILIFDDTLNTFCFICNYYDNLGAYSHVGAHKVKETQEKVCVKLQDLLDPLPVYAHTMADGKKYVILRYEI
ncbi:uncharacterized protein LOC107048513 [Diachasma alloeum]|uniref:uncharacterized protein LOC107048513 n=1 Tax=Diachasma alloeum TaxID=454923 RepID=UPI0007384242|nr:uncharacterized protein LOC107048513 [Diachasma alloeum]XP_015127185.1 uncharacterized protein LOC107048513 [Diachasma alloeum]